MEMRVISNEELVDLERQVKEFLDRCYELRRNLEGQKEINRFHSIKFYGPKENKLE